MTSADWPQVWDFFDEIVQAGETYAYPVDLTSEAPGTRAGSVVSHVIHHGRQASPRSPRHTHQGKCSFICLP
ncbi:hypothetical protein [Nocardioides pyridinolyticus]